MCKVAPQHVCLLWQWIVWWRGSNLGALGNVKYPFITIIHKFLSQDTMELANHLLYTGDVGRTTALIHKYITLFIFWKAKLLWCERDSRTVETNTACDIYPNFFLLLTIPRCVIFKTQLGCVIFKTPLGTSSAGRYSTGGPMWAAATEVRFRRVPALFWLQIETDLIPPQL